MSLARHFVWPGNSQTGSYLNQHCYTFAVKTDVAIIGAGPIGLELAAVLQEAGLDYQQFDAGQIGHTISWFPQQSQFFSSPDRISICGVPLATTDQTKASRETYLAYLRSVVQLFDLHINTYTRVTAIEPFEQEGDASFNLQLATMHGNETCQAKRVVVTIGDMHRSRLLNIPGEELPHASHYFQEPHAYFNKRVLIVGGRNSAIEAAIRCFRAGADVAISYRGNEFDSKAVKYWLKPEIDWLIKSNQIKFYPYTTPREIKTGEVVLGTTPSEKGVCATGEEKRQQCVHADFVLLMTGYEMDTSLLTGAGVQLHGCNDSPVVNLETMETNVPSLYVAGTAVAGTQRRFKLFIENCHPHVVRLARELTGDSAYSPKRMNPLGYSRLNENPDFAEHAPEVDTLEN